VFAIIGFSELGDGKLDGVYVAKGATVFYVPQDRCGSSSTRGFGMCSMSDAPGRRRRESSPVWLGLVADIKFFGRHKGGSIRDGVILSVQNGKPQRQVVIDVRPIANPAERDDPCVAHAQRADARRTATTNYCLSRGGGASQR